jgi:hypothetical protein
MQIFSANQANWAEATSDLLAQKKTDLMFAKYVQALSHLI